MSCSNCFNGCSEVTSDKCVKYTGVDIPILGIKNGDSLSYVEQSLIGFLVSVIDGTGIKIDIPSETYCQPTACTIVSNYLPTCGDITIVDLFVAVIRAACDLQTQIDVINDDLIALNADYTIPSECFPIGLLPADDTHIIVQAVINKLCSINTTLTALANNLSTNYVTLAELPALIQSYFNSISVGELMSSKMIPFAVVEYYGDLTNYPTTSDGFGPTGVGYGTWLNIFLCNGLNGTPDKRGRVGVGDTVNMGGAPLDADRATFPYQKGVAISAGVNTITLSESQMPTHTHAAPSVVTDNKHFHYEFNVDNSVGSSSLTTSNFPEYRYSSYEIIGSPTLSTIGRSSSELTNITVVTTIGSKGSSAAHNNIQPGMGCYYIMFIP